MAEFNEDTRVKIPATIQFMRIGYDYLSLKDIIIHHSTRIAVDVFKNSIEKINDVSLTGEETVKLIEEIDALIRNNDMGKSFYKRLISPVDGELKLIDFESIGNNSFGVVDELFYGPEAKGSFRPDINILINGIPLAFLEVKKPNNEGGIQAEFKRMLNDRLSVPEYKKFFNMLQIVSFSNNMEYEEDADEIISAEDIKAGSFYTTPNGNNTSFSYFREEQKYTGTYEDITTDTIAYVLKDNHYSPSVMETPEFQTNLDVDTPCNRFVTSLFKRERLLYILKYGIIYVDGQTPEKHIMRYPQFFASKAIIKRLESGGKSGIIFHTQGSGKTELAGLSVRILRDYYAKKGITARFYYVVDRLDLLTQVSGVMSSIGLSVTNVDTRSEFEKELNKALSTNVAQNSDGEITVVNVQKFDDKIPEAKNDYRAKIQRVFFVDEAHRSYKLTGTYFANLMLADTDAVYIAMTGTPLLSKKERSNLKFGDYIHKYFYDKSIADGYTLRIKKEDIETKARAEIKKNLELAGIQADKKLIMESPSYINSLCQFIKQDFENFRLVNTDKTIGGMVVCCSNGQARKIKEWFDKQDDLETGLVITDPDIPSTVNTATQKSFKFTLKPDLLIVNQMLTTGYDVRRLKKMYLLRNAKEHTLLQTISRVNRPYKSPTGKVYEYGYIVDFVDIAEEYDRTIEMYLKEMADDFSEDDEDKTGFAGLVIGPDDIQKKYLKYKEDLASFVELDNIEAFSKKLSFYTKEALYNIRKDLNGIKTCHTEFRLSKAEKYLEQIDYDRILSALKEVQHRIDFLNLKSTPVDLMAIVSNKEVCDIIYEFFKVRISIIDMSKLAEALKELVNKEQYVELQQTLTGIQNEIKRNKNRAQKEMVKLDEILQDIFARLSIENLDDINAELKDVLERMKAVNDENERMSERYNGDFGFVKTYLDACEVHPDCDKEDIAKVIDVIFASVKDIKDKNILILQGREIFTASVKKATTAELLKSGLYKKLNLKEWLSQLLNEVYTNMKLF